VDDWRVVGCHGHGAYGVVYRAVRVGHESAGPVALKLAVYPWDPRSTRELALLSLLRHSSIPRLLGHGFWQNPAGTFFPFIVMEWVEGTTLYEWAQEHNPTSRQVLQVLAQLARALEATHTSRAVHRDVKGHNILVRRSDGRAMLTDFGVGIYPAAARLTWNPWPPGTPAYQSPEARLFQLRSAHTPEAHYLAGPADDVYALGVTAYRLVTGEYPAGPKAIQDEEGTWRLEDGGLRPPQELNPQVDLQLSALILRMLSLTPEARGSAGALAEALEASARQARPEGDARLWKEEPAPVEVPPSGKARALGKARRFLVRWLPRARVLEGRPWQPWALVAVFLAVTLWREVHMHSEGAPARVQVVAGADTPEAGTAALGDTGSTAPEASAQVPSGQQSIAQDPSPKPFLEQLKPDARGHCPEREQVPIQGGCWVEYPAKDAAACEKNGYLFFKDRCYAPAIVRRRKPQPTSDPVDLR
jgi:hypothetical protein